MTKEVVEVSPLLLTNVMYSHRFEAQMEYATHQILGELFEGWPDERKADLYALLVESVKGSDSWIVMFAKVGKALEKNARRFYA